MAKSIVKASTCGETERETEKEENGPGKEREREREREREKDCRILRATLMVLAKFETG